MSDVVLPTRLMGMLGAKKILLTNAAGGVNTLADIEALYPLSIHARLEGAISGRALYEGSLNLPEALSFLRERQKNGL